MSISKIRNTLYRTGSVLGDFQALSSGKPDKILRRLLRKYIWRGFGRTMRKTRL